MIEIILILALVWLWWKYNIIKSAYQGLQEALHNMATTFDRQLEDLREKINDIEKINEEDE